MTTHPDLTDATFYAVRNGHEPHDFYSGVLFGQATRAAGPSMFCFGIALASFLHMMLPDSWWGTSIILIAVIFSHKLVRAVDRLIFLSVPNYREGIK